MDDDLIRELYARFGLAYYQSECLHRGLCMALVWSGLPSRDLITGPRVEEQLAEAFSLTLGDVASQLERVLPTDLNETLREAVDIRNYLAHQFWFERAHLMFSVEKVRKLISELDTYVELFERLDNLVSKWSEPKRQELGLTDNVLQDRENRILAGESEVPLPDRQTVQELKKKLGKRQRLTKVWEFTSGDGGKPLIFELADGSLWQLCDVGLGWTRFQNVGSGWTEEPAIKPHLPADIIPRPKVTAPWDFHFMLANEAVLWVKPGRLKQTFKYGVRTSKPSS